VHIHDILADLEYTWAEGHRGYWAAVIGVIVIHRTQVLPFTDKQIELVITFADQAVIAIENVWLFKELEARTADLTRSVGELQGLGESARR
jgi:two-component system NtrC family sensor kinase